MSTLTQRHRFCEFLLENLAGDRTYKGSKMKDVEYINGRRVVTHNLSKVLDVQIIWFCILYDLGFGSKKHAERSFQRLIMCTKNLDVYQWLKDLDRFDDHLLSSTKAQHICLRRGEWETALTSQGCDPEFTNALSALLLPEFNAWYKSQIVSGFNKLHQAFTFCKRLSLQNQYLADVALAGWKESEFGVPARIFRNLPEAAVIREWFPKSRAHEVFKDHFFPRHGPGAVREGCKTVAEKYLCLGLNSIQRQFIREYELQENVGYPSKRLMQRALHARRTWRRNVHCTAVFVNKSWKTYRTISMESVTNMWLQQGLFSCIEWWLKTYQSDMSLYYTVDSESENRWLAEEGSVDGYYATIDLHAASDLISWSLVAELFRDTWLEDALYAFRSVYCTVPSDNMSVYEQMKFAPMGAADCFPILTIVCAACVEVACRQTTHLTSKELGRDGWPVAAQYGDDIVVRSTLVPAVLSRLEHLGLVVNREKSFYNTTGNFFRESCGGEYLNGEDITPLRIPRTFPGFMHLTKDSMKDQPESLATLVDLCNSLFDMKFLTARALIVDNLLHKCKIPLIFCKSGAHGLKSVQTTNQHLKKNFDDDLQKTLYRAAVLVPSVPDTASFIKKPSMEYLKRTLGVNALRNDGRFASYLRDESAWWESPHDATGWADAAYLYQWLQSNPRRSVKADGITPDPLIWPDQRTEMAFVPYERQNKLMQRKVDLEFPDDSEVQV